MKPNCNAGKLITCIVLDVLLWSWLIPLVISMIFGGLGSMAMGLLNGGFDQIFGVSQFHPLSRIFLGTGMISGAVLVGCGICGLFKAVFHWVKAIVRGSCQGYLRTFKEAVGKESCTQNI